MSHLTECKNSSDPDMSAKKEIKLGTIIDHGFKYPKQVPVTKLPNEKQFSFNLS